MARVSETVVLSNSGRLLRFICAGLALIMVLQLFFIPVTYATIEDITPLDQEIISNTDVDVSSVETITPQEILPAGLGAKPVEKSVIRNVVSNEASLVNEEAPPLVDTVPPTAPEASVPPGYYNTTQSVELSATDDSDPAPLIYYTTDGSAPNQTSQPYIGAISVDATTTINAIAYDGARNPSTVSTFEYVIDTEKPIIKDIKYSNDGEPTKNDVTVTVTINEPVKTPAGWDQGENDMTVKKEYDSNHSETLTVEDLAGNESAEKTIEVKGIDKDDPTIVINGTSENGVYTSAVTYRTDDKVDVSSVTINGFAAPEDGTISRSGTYTIIVKDTAENEIQEQIFIFIPIATIPDPETALTATTVPDPISPLRRTNPTPVVVFTQVDNTNNKDEDDKEEQDLGLMGGAPDTTVAAIAPSSEGWKILGIAWYWLLLAFSLIAAAWWALSSWYRHREDDIDIEL